MPEIRIKILEPTSFHENIPAARDIRTFGKVFQRTIEETIKEELFSSPPMTIEAGAKVSIATGNSKIAHFPETNIDRIDYALKDYGGDEEAYTYVFSPVQYVVGDEEFDI